MYVGEVVVLGVVQTEADTGDTVKRLVGDVAPAHEAYRVDITVRLWHEAGGSQHGEKIEEGENFVNGEDVVFERTKGGRK